MTFPLIPSPEERAREVHANRVAYTATELSVAIGTVAIRARHLENRLTEAARHGLPRREAEAMLYDLDGIDVQAILDRAYGPGGKS